MKQQQSTLPVHSNSSSWRGSSTITQGAIKLQEIWGEQSRYGSETLAKTDQSSHFLTFQHGEGCLPLDPEVCHHSSPAVLVQTLIDSLLTALIVSLRWHSYHRALHPAALPRAPDIFLCFLWCYFCCSLALLMFCTARRFQHHPALAVRYKGTGRRGRCLSGKIWPRFSCSPHWPVLSKGLCYCFGSLCLWESRFWWLMPVHCTRVASNFPLKQGSANTARWYFFPGKRFLFYGKWECFVGCKRPWYGTNYHLIYKHSPFVPVRGKNTLFKLWTFQTYHKLGRHCPPKWPVQMIHQTSYWIPQWGLWTQHLLLPRLCWSQPSDLPALTWEQAVDELELLQSDLTRDGLFFFPPCGMVIISFTF